MKRVFDFSFIFFLTFITTMVYYIYQSVVTAAAVAAVAGKGANTPGAIVSTHSAVIAVCCFVCTES